MSRYNRMELMITVAARVLEDGRIVAIGTGAPCAAAMLAQKTHAPNLILLFEAGGFGPLLPTMPVSVGDSRTFYRALMATSMRDVMACVARGMVDYCFLGGAQIDPYGNINSTMIGKDFHHPKVRMPGSGGANDLASHAWRSLVVTIHDKRRFVEKMDFVTSPGYLDGPGARERVGLPKDTGPYKVITDLAVMGHRRAGEGKHGLRNRRRRRSAAHRTADRRGTAPAARRSRPDALRHRAVSATCAIVLAARPMLCRRENMHTVLSCSGQSDRTHAMLIDGLLSRQATRWSERNR